MRPRHLSLMRAVVVGVAVLFAGMYFLVALPRIFYPYDLDFIEDSMLLQSWQFAQGLPVFVPPNADFVPHQYMPLYSWIGGWLLRVTGPEMAPLRLLSFAAVLMTTALVFYIARREAKSNWLAIVCAGLVLAGYRLTGQWYELVRVDALFLALSLAGMTVGIYSEGRTGRILVSALLLALAFWTKQTALVYAAGILLLLWLRYGRGALWFAAAYFLFTVPPFLLINSATEGWFWFHTITVSGNDPVEFGRVVNFVTRDLLGGMAGVSLLALGATILAVRNARDRRPLALLSSQPWLLIMALGILVSAVGRASVGGNLNNLMSAYTLLCLAPALFYRECATVTLPTFLTLRRIEFGLVTLVLLQFVLGVYNPFRYMPTSEMRTAGDNLVARIAATDGNVFVMMHPYYALRAGKQPSAQALVLWYMLERGGQPMPHDLIQRFETKYYTSIISDETVFENAPAFRALLDTYYLQTETLADTQSPQTNTGVVSRPMSVYQPKE